MSIENYLAGNRYSEIKVGRSGADVYEINGNLILKHVERRKLEGSLFDTYAREALFYRAKAEHTGSYLPRIIKLEISEDEIILLMEKYSCPDRGDMDEQMIRKVIKNDRPGTQRLRSGVPEQRQKAFRASARAAY